MLKRQPDRRLPGPGRQRALDEKETEAGGGALVDAERRVEAVYE
jgi:hypothetical protein